VSLTSIVTRTSSLRQRNGGLPVTFRFRKRARRRGSKYWAAISALSALISSGPALPTRAASLFPQQTQAVNSARSSINIPAGPLGLVIDSFRHLTGIEVAFASTSMRNISSPGVACTCSPTQALERLLEKTGISFKFSSPSSVTLEIANLAASIEIIDKAGALSTPKYTEPLRDIPQTVTVIPSSLMEQQAATSLSDVLRNVSGLTMTAGEGGVPAGDNLTIRGFSARNDIFVDGSRDLGPQTRDPFNTEQVEVAKGPSSAFNGRGSTGGSINLVTKTPRFDRYFAANVNLGTDGTRRVAADINIPLSDLRLGESNAFRLNLLSHRSGVAGRDQVENQRWGVAPSLSLGLTRATRLTLNYFHLDQDNLPDYGVPWVPSTNNVLVEYRDKPAPVPRNSFYGLLARDFENVKSDLGTVRFDWSLSDSSSLRQQFRYGRTTRDSITTSPRFASNDSLVITRNGPSWITGDNILDSQTDFRGDFSTGSIKHSAVIGANITREENKRQLRTVTGTPTTTLFNPDPFQPFNGVIALNPNIGDITGQSQAFYVFDTAQFGKKLQLNGGIRWDRFDVNGINTAQEKIERVDKMLSWRGAVVYKPAETGSIYFAAGSSLNPSLEGLSYSIANTSIEPEKTYTYEVGTKWDLLSQKLLLSAAVFRVDKTNARTPGLSPDDPPQVLDGRQRVDGIELGFTGNITRRWNVFGAYTLLDSEIVESNTPAEIGKHLLNTPRNSMNIWTTYESRWKFTLGGGIRIVGHRYGNNINTRQVDSYWTLDMLASYPINKHLDLRLNLYNLNNAYYYDRLGGGHLVPGAARSANLSLGLRF